MVDDKDSDRALVLGLGCSGEAAARLLAAHGNGVTVVDGGDSPAIRERVQALRALDVRVVTGASELPLDEFGLCVVSPGIDHHSEWVREAARRGIDVISELELGFRYCECPLVAVTGTNGKSTLVKLIHDTLEAAGLRSAIAGNYGVPLCDMAPKSEELDWMVVEVSSFQLETVSSFRPRVGVLLNLQPDHLDRHGDMDTYRELKSRLFAHMGARDVGIVHDVEMAAVQRLGAGTNSWVSFGLSEQCDARYDETGEVVIRRPGGEERIDVSGSGFANPILGQAAAAAAAVVIACGVDLAVLSSVLQRFAPLSHRMAAAGTVDGVIFVDDSKATNLAALVAGVKMSNCPVRLVAGGQLKEKDLSIAKEVLASQVASVYLIGQAAESMNCAWQDLVPCVPCGDLETATRAAWSDASAGECVLLSPGCASFDQFESYKDRGEQFCKIVEEINEERRHEDIISD